MSAGLAVVHLVREVNGIGAFTSFLDSYACHGADAEHDLILLFKGFTSSEGLEPYRQCAAGLATGDLEVSDDGLDLTAYLAAARRLDHSRICFLNSFTTIEAPGWLGLLAEPLDEPATGLVGATGSWGSHRSFALSLLGLPNGYRGSLGDRRSTGPALRSVGSEPDIGRLRRAGRAMVDLPREIVGYPGFPAPHVRTNAFAIERELLLSLRSGRLATKSAAYRFEGGTRGLTAQVRARGLEVVVAGRQGGWLRPEAWPEADIYFQGEQRDLLVADNQTRAYADGTPAQRAALAAYAWGPRARPG